MCEVFTYKLLRKFRKEKRSREFNSEVLALVESPLVRVRNPTKSQWAVGKGKRIRSKRRQALGLIDYRSDGQKLLWRHFTIQSYSDRHEYRPPTCESRCRAASFYSCVIGIAL